MTDAIHYAAADELLLVLLAITIPTRSPANMRTLLAQVITLLQSFELPVAWREQVDSRRQAAVSTLEDGRGSVSFPGVSFGPADLTVEMDGIADVLTIDVFDVWVGELNWPADQTRKVRPSGSSVAFAVCAQALTFSISSAVSIGLAWFSPMIFSFHPELVIWCQMGSGLHNSQFRFRPAKTEL